MKISCLMLPRHASPHVTMSVRACSAHIACARWQYFPFGPIILYSFLVSLPMHRMHCNFQNGWKQTYINIACFGQKQFEAHVEWQIYSIYMYMYVPNISLTRSFHSLWSTSWLWSLFLLSVFSFFYLVFCRCFCQPSKSFIVRVAVYAIFDDFQKRVRRMKREHP